jgi:hypothetical protein
MADKIFVIFHLLNRYWTHFFNISTMKFTMIKKILTSFDFLSLGENHMKCIKDIIDKASKETTRALSVAAVHDEDV